MKEIFESLGGRLDAGLSAFDAQVLSYDENLELLLDDLAHVGVLGARSAAERVNQPTDAKSPGGVDRVAWAIALPTVGSRPGTE